MRHIGTPLALLLALPLGACNGDDASTGTDTASATGTTTTSATTTATTAATMGGTATESSSTGSGSDSNTSGSSSSSTTDGTATATSGTTGTSGTSTTSDTTTTTGGVSSTGDTTTGGDCGGGGIVDYSFIWISNSPENTVSKINTMTLVEEARYNTGPNGDPSRTSVNLKGAVAVVNRGGGVTKIAAVEDECVDKNNDGMIFTSKGANDVKPWGQDECALWNTPLPAASRPAAWTSGEKQDPNDPCSPLINEHLWVSAPQGSDAFVYLLNGETGAIIKQVLVPGANGGLGIYGGGVDANNDFWGVTYSQGPLVHVRYADFTFETIPLPGFSGGAYGFTVDSKGRSWVGGWDNSLIRYDPMTKEWVQTTGIPGQYNGLSRGMNEDENGDLWAAFLGFGGPQGILRVDTDTATFVEMIDDAKLSGVSTPTGASVDIMGKIWMVDQSKDGGGAFVYNPADMSVKWVGGLNGPYTYSDMTGYALKNVLPQ
ncbi:MAG TPA: hypothetical protein PKW35_14570 [Nannocystaceae bacterium]|nr:hypothetical protein [Nannocystaceae bacterium]